MHAYADMYMYMYIPYGLYIPKDMNNTENREYSHVVFFPDITHLMMEFYYWHDHFLVMIIFAEYLEDHPM